MAGPVSVRRQAYDFEAIFESAMDGMAIIGLDGAYIRQNPAHRRLLGYPDKELEGQTPALHLGEEAFAEITRELAQNGSYRGTVPSRTRDGRLLHVELSASTLHDRDGRPHAYLGIKRDVTRLRQAEDSLRAHAHRLHELYRLGLAKQEAADERGVLEAALDTLLRLGLADRAAVLLLDEEQVMRFGAWRGLSAAYRRAVEGHSPWPAGGSDPQPIEVEDAAAEPSLAPFHDALREEGIAALAFIPLVHKGTLLGKFMLYQSRKRHLTEDEIHLAVTVGASVASAVVRLRADAELRRSQHELRDFVENATEPMHWVDDHGIVLWCNQAELDLLGYTQDEYIGRHIGFVHEDPVALEEIMDALRQGRTLHAAEVRLRAKDGSIKTVLMDSSGLWENGRFVHSRCFLRDITDRKHIEEELRDSRVYLEAAQETAHVGHWTLRDGRLRFSDELLRIVGRKRPARPDLEVVLSWVHEDDRSRVRAALERAQAGQGFTDMHRVVRPSGESRWVRSRATCTRGGLLVTVLDVTEMREAEELRVASLRKTHELEALQALHEARSRFVSMAAHELRTPLGPMKAEMSLLRMGALDEDQQHAVDALEQNTARLSRFIDDLLQVARMDAGRVVLDRGPTDLREVLEAVADMHGGAAASAGVRLEVGPMESCVVDGDRTRLEQVFTNLVANALRATPEDGHVRLMLRREGDQAVAVVGDSGVGLRAEDLDHIFEPFTQVPGRPGQGTGLGLYICRTLVTLHGGSIGCHSSGPGQGATFTVTLPLS